MSLILAAHPSVRSSALFSGRFSVVLLSLLISYQAQAEDRTGKIYEIGKTDVAPLFIQKTHKEPMGPLPNSVIEHRSTIADSAGKEVMREEANYKDTALIYNHVMQLQSNESYQVDNRDGRLYFKTFTIQSDGSEKLVKEADQSLPPDFVMGPISEVLLQSKWDDLMAGKTVTAHFGVLEMQDTVRFDFSKLSYDGKTLVVKMKPTSFFISLVVKPIELQFDGATKKITRYIGRTPLKRMVKGKLEPFDAEIIYE